VITIHAAQSDEVHQIRELLRRTWIDTYRQLLPEETIRAATSSWHTPEVLHGEINDDNTYFAIAKNEAGDVVGLTTVAIRCDLLMMTRLYVDPHAQRKGIGSQLLQAAINQHPDARMIRLEVEQNNAKGYGFYRKMGFHETSRKELKIDNMVIPVIEMELMIAR